MRILSLKDIALWKINKAECRRFKHFFNHCLWPSKHEKLSCYTAFPKFSEVFYPLLPWFSECLLNVLREPSRNVTWYLCTTARFFYLPLTPASQVEVWCPWVRGLQPQLHPKAEEYPQAYQPATQPRASPRPVPHYSTRHTEARSPVEVKWTNPRNEGKNTGTEGETLNQESGGREGNQEKRYATRRSRHATLTKLRVQREHNVGT